MTTDTTRMIDRIPLEVLNKGDFGLIDQIVATDFVEHSPQPGFAPTRDGLKQNLKALKTAFPDLHYTIDDEVAEGDRVWQRITGHGTMKGDFQGMPASGKEATWSEIHIVRFADGKAVEHWGVVDQLAMLAQLGFAQVPGQPAGVAG